MGILTGNYDNGAYFEYNVYPGVEQIPISALGKTRYTNEEMENIARLSLEEKRSFIGNLYEAIQLFQISGFKGALDNADYFIATGRLCPLDEGAGLQSGPCDTPAQIHWQMHKSPENAVLTNEGCCATDTNWLSFFLKDRYDSMGSFCFGCPDQNGHITSYILHGGVYYFIDMMMCRKDSQEFFDREVVPPSLREKQEWSGYLYCCKEPVQICHFYLERFRATGRNTPYCFYLREADHVTATGAGCDEKGIVTFYAPECDRPRLLYLDPLSEHGFCVVPLPEFDSRGQ